MPDKNDGIIEMPKLDVVKKLQVVIGLIFAIMTSVIIISVAIPSMFLIAALLFFISYGMIFLLFIKLLKVKKL